MTQISVVIPLFNCERYIGESVRSVWGQTYPPLEIIIVDDGSTDQSANIVLQMVGPVPITYHYQQNQGQAAARNLGVSLARGDWVSFLDQDDVWYSDKLAVQVDCIKEHPEARFIYSVMDYIDEHGQLKSPPRVTDALAPLLYNEGRVAFPSTVLLKKDVFLNSGGFNSSLRIGEDTELFARIARKSPLYCIFRSLVKYRLHGGQAHRDKRFWAMSWPLFHHCMWELWQDEPSKRAILARETARVYSGVGKHFLRIGNSVKAREYFRLSLSYRPWFWINLRRWGLSYVPGVRQVYSYRMRNRTIGS